MGDDTDEWPILRYFKYDHLPGVLQCISKPFHDLAHELVGGGFEDISQMYCAIEKLLEAKDCAVRAYLK